MRKILHFLAEADEATINDVYALLCREKRRKEKEEALLKEIQKLKEALAA